MFSAPPITNQARAEQTGRARFSIHNEAEVIQATHAGKPKKLSATLLLAASLILPASALTQAPAPQQFEVASIKRNRSDSRPWLAPPVAGRYTATNIPLKLFIAAGWPLKLVGAPSWVLTDGYDISAILPRPDASPDDFRQMMQNLLKDRFALKVHTETREAQVYVLLPAKTGLKLPDAIPEPCISGRKPTEAEAQAGCAAMNVTPESITNQKISMEWFTTVLAGMLGRPVRNETGFTGSFKVNLDFAPLAPDTTSPKPSLFEALEQQLGLRLVTQKGTEEVLVIDHVERPTEN